MDGVDFAVNLQTLDGVAPPPSLLKGEAAFIASCSRWRPSLTFLPVYLIFQLLRFDARRFSGAPIPTTSRRNPDLQHGCRTLGGSPGDLR